MLVLGQKVITCSGLAEAPRKRPKIWTNLQMLQKPSQDGQAREEGNTRSVWDYALKCPTGPGQTVSVPETGNLLNVFNPVAIFSSLG